jgi:hypothetical protein
MQQIIANPSMLVTASGDSLRENTGGMARHGECHSHKSCAKLQCTLIWVVPLSSVWHFFAEQVLNDPPTAAYSMKAFR